MSFAACENVVDDIENAYSWTIGASLGAGNTPFNETGVRPLNSPALPGLVTSGMQFVNFCTVSTIYYGFGDGSSSGGDENVTAVAIHFTNLDHDAKGNATTRVIVSDCYQHDEFNISSAPTTVFVHSPTIFIYVERRPNSLTQNPDCGGKDRVEYIAGPLQTYCGQFPDDSKCSAVKGKTVSLPSSTSSPRATTSAGVPRSGSKKRWWMAVAGICIGLVATTTV